MVHYDYELVSCEMWRYLKSWYGLQQGHQEIIRPCRFDRATGGKFYVDLYFNSRTETPWIDD